jgi:hypothetical protein
MKKIVLFIAAAFIAVSCSDDDSNSARPINTDLLVGKWDMVSSFYNGSPVEINDCDTGTYKEFTSDGHFNEYYTCGNTNYEDNATYTVNGNVVTCDVVGDPGPDEDIFTFKVVELSEDIMVTEYNGFDEDNKPEKLISTFNRIQE